MKSVIIVILTLLTIEVVAQNHEIGITGGPNWTNVTSSNIFRNSDFRNGVSGGLTYENFVKNNFSIGADLIYNQRGFMDYFEGQSGEQITTNNSYDYFSVPLKFGFYDVGNKLFGFAKIGLIPSILIDAKTTLPTLNMGGEMTGMETLHITKNVSKFDLAGLAEIGGGYTMVDRLSLTVSFIYQHSVTSISNSEYFANNKIRHNGMSLNLGFKWALKKE